MNFFTLDNSQSNVELDIVDVDVAENVVAAELLSLQQDADCGGGSTMSASFPSDARKKFDQKFVSYWWVGRLSGPVKQRASRRRRC